MDKSEAKKHNKKVLAKFVDYQRTFDTETGKKVLHDLMKQFHMLGSTFVKGDSQETFLREGERNVVIYILSKMKTDVKKLEKQIEEANNDED